jgi:zinc transporter, ZIP family
MTTVNDPNLGLAFGLTFAAGMATAIGAAVVFVPGLIKLASRKTLAGALGLSAGVMTYVSFVEIFGKSRSNFESAGNPANLAYVYATSCFFGGVVLMTVRSCGGVSSRVPLSTSRAEGGPKL